MLDTVRDIGDTVNGTKLHYTFRIHVRNGEAMIKRSKITYILAMTAACATVLMGCSSQRLEDELAYRQVGLNSMETGDYEEAITAFNAALSQHIGSITNTEIDICYYKAAAQYASGDIESAYNTYTDLISFDDEDSNAYYMRGCLLLQMGDSEKALLDYANAVKNNAEDYELYIHIYENLASYSLAEDGETYLNKAFDIKGDSAENLTWRGRIYLLLGQYDNAAEELKAALTKGSTDANLYLAQVYDAQGDVENAKNHYEAYMAAGAADSEAMNALAEIEISKGNYTAALDYINQGLAMENVPNKKALMQNKIIAYEYTSDFSGAWEVIQEYVALYPEDMDAQREYIFLKNRQNIIEAEVVVPEGADQSAEQSSETQAE